MITRSWFRPWLAIVVTLSLLASCAGSVPKPVVTRPVITPRLIFIPTPVTPVRIDLDAFAPPGPGRDLVINNCGSCHSFVCALRGQRTAEHWKGIESTHKQRMANLPPDDYSALFAYLRENFDNTKPEPNLPPNLAEQGCTIVYR